MKKHLLLSVALVVSSASAAKSDPYCWMELRGRTYNLESICQIDRSASKAPVEKDSTALPPQQDAIYLSDLGVGADQYLGSVLRGTIKNLTNERIKISYLEIQIKRQTFFVAVNLVISPGEAESFKGDLLTTDKLSAQGSDITILGYQDEKGWHKEGFQQQPLY